MATGGMYLCSAMGMVIGIAASSSIQISTLRSLLLQNLHGPGTAKASPPISRARARAIYTPQSLTFAAISRRSKKYFRTLGLSRVWMRK